MMRTSNPALNAKAFNQVSNLGEGQVMTLDGTVNRSLVLLGLLVLTATWVWGKVMQPVSPMFAEAMPVQASFNVMPFVMGGGIFGFIFAMITIFKKEWAGITAPIYALCEGFVLGGISAIFEMQYPGIVMQAVALTFGTLFSLLLAYKSGMIKATENFKLGMVAAMGAIVLVYIASFIMGFFGASIPMIHSSGPIGIGFSLVIVVVAALNLVLDFDFIERGVEQRVPKYMEWYGAFGLMVTLVWLYMEILRLLSKLRER